MNQLCNCKRDKIKDTVKTILLEERSFFNRDARSLENSAEIHTHVIENIVSDIVHKQSCNIGELLQAERENTIVVDTHGKEIEGETFPVCRVCDKSTNEIMVHGACVSCVGKLVEEHVADDHPASYFGIDLAMGEDNTTYVLKKEYSTEELKVPVPCKDCMEDLHDWRIWSQSQGETNFVCAKCFWRKTKRAAINPGPGTYGEVFDDVIKPPLKLNLN